MDKINFAVTMPPNKFRSYSLFIYVPDKNNDDGLKMKTIMHQNLGMRVELQV